MANVLVEKQSLIDAADAIRSKLGTQALIAPEDFDDRISEISGVGDYGTVTVCAASYAGAIGNNPSGCSPTLDDEDAFYDFAIANGLFQYTGSQYRVQFSWGGTSWQVQGLGYDSKYFSEEELAANGLTTNVVAGTLSCSLIVNYTYSVDTSDTTTLNLTALEEYLSLGYFKTDYSGSYGGSSNDGPDPYIIVGGEKYMRIAVLNYSFGTDCDFIPDAFLSWCPNFNQDIVIPSGITRIGDYFLTNNYTYTGTITIPSSVTEIGNGFLYYCTGYNQPITIPSSVKKIGSSFLENCSGYNQPLSFPSVEEVGGRFLESCMIFNSTLSMPAIKKIGVSFLYGCYVFNQPIPFLSSVTSIGTSFLGSCYAFNQTITLSSSLKAIPQEFLYACRAFNTAFTIPSSVTMIDGNFLYGCEAFNKQITIPSSVTFLDGGFLYGCYSFNQDITFPSTILYLNPNGSYLYNCNAMTSTVTVETAATKNSDTQTFSTNSNTAACYTTGIKVGGTYGSAWRSALANRTSNPYRKLIAA